VSSLARRLDRVRWLAVPLAAYLLVTLILPAANGAAARADFAHHALWVAGACAAVIAVAFAVTWRKP
jgi:hypothetical protein